MEIYMSQPFNEKFAELINDIWQFCFPEVLMCLSIC